jgi:hypothetical protein
MVTRVWWVRGAALLMLAAGVLGLYYVGTAAPHRAGGRLAHVTPGGTLHHHHSWHLWHHPGAGRAGRP